MSALDRIADMIADERALSVQLGEDPGLWMLKVGMLPPHAAGLPIPSPFMLTVEHDGELIAAGQGRTIEDAAIFCRSHLRSALAKRGTPEELLETALVVSIDTARARKAARR